MKLWTLCASCVLALAASAGAATPLKIMPLGDSITKGDANGGYRAPLYQKLTDAAVDFQFVGSLNVNSTTALTNSGNAQHEGHGGWYIKEPSKNAGELWRLGIYGTPDNGKYGYTGDKSGLETWLPAYQPDIILLHIGTNDAAAYRTASAMTSDLDSVLTRISTYSPNAKVLLAKIIPVRSDYNNGGGAYVNSTFVVPFNNSMDTLVTQHRALGQDVMLVDQYTGFNTGTMYADSLHPNTLGYDRMATVWSNAIQQAIPEPGSFSILLIGAPLLLNRWRKRSADARI